MKVALLAYGSRGDVQPFVALSLALKARGHAPLLAAPENFKEFVQSYGLDYAPLPGDTRAMLEEGGAARNVLKGNSRAFFVEVARRMEPLQERLWEGLAVAVSGADCAVSSPVLEFLGPSVAEAKGVRSVLSFFSPQPASAEFAHLAFPVASFGLPWLDRASHTLADWGWWSIQKEGVNRARRHFGLKPWARSPTPRYLEKGGSALMAFSPDLFPRPKDWAKNLLVTGSWQMPENAAPGGTDSRDAADPGFVAWLEEGPPVYFGFGSMPVPHHDAFVEMASEICEELGMRALIGPGWNDLTMQACDLPDNVAVIEHADHAWLFPQCAAIVHHGGAGTTHAAVRAGVPSVVGSFFADQPFWGRRIEALGLGRHLPFKKLRPEGLKRALLDALGESTQARAAAMGEKLRREDGCAAAVSALETLGA